MSRLASFLALVIVTPATFAEVYSYKGQDTYLQPLPEDNRYLNDKGNVVGLRSSFFIKLDSNAPITSLLQTYDLELLKEYSNQLYQVQPKSTVAALLAVIETVDADALTLDASPNFLKKIDVS